MIRHLKSALKNTIRVPLISLATITVMTIMLFFVELGLFTRYALESFVHTVNEKITITLYLKGGYDQTSSATTDLLRNITALDTSIRVRYISPEEASQIMRARDERLSEILSLEKSPFPPAVEIAGVPLSRYEGVDAVISARQEMIQYRNTSGNFSLDYRSQYDRIQALSRVATNILSIVTLFTIVCLVCAIIVMYVAMTWVVRAFDREREVIRLVGGNRSALYVPFILQGLLYTGISFIALALSAHLLIEIIASSGAAGLREFTHTYLASQDDLLLLSAMTTLLLSAAASTIAARQR